MYIVSPPSAIDVHRQDSDRLTISSNCLTCSLLKLILHCSARAYKSTLCSNECALNETFQWRSAWQYHSHPHEHGRLPDGFRVRSRRLLLLRMLCFVHRADKVRCFAYIWMPPASYQAKHGPMTPAYQADFASPAIAVLPENGEVDT